MEKERNIGEYERNAIAKALQTVKKNLSENFNNQEKELINAIKIDIKKLGKWENGKFIVNQECFYEDGGEKYLVINNIPYPEINRKQTDVGYQIINEDKSDVVYIGEFVDGKKDGHCMRFSNGGMFEGEFSNDEPINNYR